MIWSSAPGTPTAVLCFLTVLLWPRTSPGPFFREPVLYHCHQPDGPGIPAPGDHAGGGHLRLRRGTQWGEETAGLPS